MAKYVLPLVIAGAVLPFAAMWLLGALTPTLAWLAVSVLLFQADVHSALLTVSLPFEAMCEPGVT